ncbi:hypothetical protein [Chryseobacterium sp. SIMBA_028]|uniref:hypothetical protein n=1 Tax=Chryseobacterium sp. SIMBA_028 TaxID=3085771 RepID=UPI00397A334D
MGNRGKIEDIIDKTLNLWIENGLNMLPCNIEEEMLAPDSLMKNGNHGFLLKVPLLKLNFRNLKLRTDLFFPKILEYL